MKLPPFSLIVRKLLLEDWLLKAVCLAFAILMWFYVDGELTDIRDINVKVKPSDISMPDGYELMPGRPMPEVIVRLRVPKRRLQFTTADSISIRPKLTIPAPTEGRSILQFDESNIAGEGFSVITVAPKEGSDVAVDLIPMKRSSVGDLPARQLRLPVRVMPAQGAALWVEPAMVELEVAAEAEILAGLDIQSNVLIYLEWPEEWSLAKSNQENFGPKRFVVQVRAPSNVQVRGSDGGLLPTVEVRGARAPRMKQPADSVSN